MNSVGRSTYGLCGESINNAAEDRILLRHIYNSNVKRIEKHQYGKHKNGVQLIDNKPFKWSDVSVR